MNFALRLLLPALIFMIMVASSHAQSTAAKEEGEKRVQYQLVLPEEKTPETVKPEEHNPFESESDALSRKAPGDTEENRVRDKLLKLPVVGTKRMPDGRMRVLLGDIILETGAVVPPVLPEQLVELRVKNITTQYIELAWQEKRVTGLPPKLMIIPIKITPQVRYQMLGQSADGTNGPKGGTNARMDLPLRDIQPNPTNTPPKALSAEPGQPGSQIIADDPQPFTPPRVVTPGTPAAQQANAPAKPAGTPPATTSPSPAVESMVRMLFGNPAPAPK